MKDLISKIIFLICFSIFSTIANATDTVRVAIIGPMGGASASVGMQYNAGVSAALSKLPDGKLLGKTVITNLFDDKCNTKIAKAVAEQVIATPPAVVIGHSCSGSTIAGAPYYAKQKVLQITPASTHPKVTNMGISTIFRMIGRDDAQGKLAAQRIMKQHANQRLGILRFPGAYSQILIKTALEELEKHNLKPALLVDAKPGEASYANEVKRFLQDKIDILYIVGGGLDTGIFMRQARLMGANFSVISSDTLISKVFQKTAKEAANNIPFTFPPETQRLASASQAVQIIEDMGYEPVGYTLLAYAATQVWIEGVKRAQSFDADSVAKALRSSPLQSVLGEISFDSKGDIITTFEPFVWYEWQNGKRVQLD